MSWSVGAASSARDWAPTGCSSDAVKEAGDAVRADCGTERLHVCGRSRVIQWFLVCVGEVPVGDSEATGFPGWERASTCGWATTAPTPGVAWDNVTGCGTTVAAVTPEPPDAQPVVTATNTPSAATRAMTDRLRRLLPARRTFTVARLYNSTLGRESQRAVKTIRVRCGFADNR